MARNRNRYSRSKDARKQLAGLRKKYPWLKSSSPVVELMRRKYAHPDEVTFAIDTSYDGVIPDSIDGFSSFLTDSSSPYNAFANDAWDVITQFGPMTLEDFSGYIPDGVAENGRDNLDEYITSLMRGAERDDNEDSDAILSNYGGPMEYDDKFLAYEDALQDLFDDARAYGKARKAIRAAQDSKDTWLDKLYAKRNPVNSDAIEPARRAVDSNGMRDTKGPDGLENTDDDATQRNILNALLRHKL